MIESRRIRKICPVTSQQELLIRNAMELEISQLSHVLLQRVASRISSNPYGDGVKTHGPSQIFLGMNIPFASEFGPKTELAVRSFLGTFEAKAAKNKTQELRRVK